MQELRKDFDERFPSSSLPIEEIENRYRGEWVVLDDTEFVERSRVVSGRVIFHSTDREVAYKRAIELAPTKAAVLYMGELPDDVEYVL